MDITKINLNPGSEKAQGWINHISNNVIGYYSLNKKPLEAEIQQNETLTCWGTIINTVENKKISFDSVYVCIDDIALKAERTERLGLAEKHGEKCLMSGFRLIGTLPELEPGEHTLRVMGVSAEGMCCFIEDSVKLKVIPIAPESELKKYSRITDFDIELQKICCKYGLEVNSRSNLIYFAFIECFVDILRRIPNDEPIALYGYSQQLKLMYNRIDLSSNNIVCVVNDKVNTSIEATTGKSIPVVTIEKMYNYSFKRIIIIEFLNSSIKKEIFNSDKYIEMYCIYDELRRKGIKCKESFDIYYKWQDLSPLIFAYKEALSPEKKQENLKILIQEYFNCRDFICANLYIQEYIDGHYDNSNSYIELKNEIKQFLHKIKEEIRQKTNKHIYVFVLDSLSYEIFKSAPFMQSLAKRSLSFNNAYSPVFHTRPSYQVLFTEKRFVTDKLFETNYIYENDSTFYSDMKNKGIKIKIIGSSFLGFMQNINDYECATESKISIFNWNMLMDIIAESADTIYFVHSNETHPPFHSGNPKKPLTSNAEYYEYCASPEKAPLEYFKNMNDLHAYAVAYADQQLEFVVNLLDIERNTLIVTSDHMLIKKHIKLAQIPLKPDMYKIPLVIHSKSAKPGRYEDIYSSSELTNILRHIMSGDQELTIAPYEYARQEYQPSYGKNLILDRGYGFIVLNTAIDKYVFNLDGCEEYYLFPNVELNLVSDPQYKKRIDYFRSQIDIDTREVWKFMFERYPVMLEIHQDRVLELLNENKNPQHLISIVSP